jgi:hypothetical protein
LSFSRLNSDNASAGKKFKQCRCQVLAKLLQKSQAAKVYQVKEVIYRNSLFNFGSQMWRKNTMKKVFLIVIAIAAMAGMSNALQVAQPCGINRDGSTASCVNDAGSYCSNDQANPFVLDCVNVWDDPENCGWVGLVCPTGLKFCSNGTCMESDPMDDYCIGGNQPSTKPQAPLAPALSFDNLKTARRRKLI